MLNIRIVAPKPKLISRNVCREFCQKTQEKSEKINLKTNISIQNDNFIENLTQEFQDKEAKEEIIEILKNDSSNPIHFDTYKKQPNLPFNSYSF